VALCKEALKKEDHKLDRIRILRKAINNGGK